MWLRVHINTYIYIYRCVYIYMYMCVYIYIYILVPFNPKKTVFPHQHWDASGNLRTKHRICQVCVPGMGEDVPTHLWVGSDLRDVAQNHGWEGDETTEQCSKYMLYISLFMVSIWTIYGWSMDNLWSSGWWLSHPSEKYEFVTWDDELPNIWENKKCSKPPTSHKLWWLINQENTDEYKHITHTLINDI